MDLYVLDICVLRGREEEALSLLSPQRREKALRIRSGEERLRSVAAGLLLGRFVGEGPFCFGPQGKPALPGGPDFSLSHSGRCAVLALDGQSVGADIERIAPVREAVARRVLTRDEQEWMAQDAQRRFAFLWTRKEAAVKWDGCGIACSLASLSVLPGETAELHGRRCALHTVEYSGYMISAAGQDPQFVPRAVTWEELLT